MIKLKLKSDFGEFVTVYDSNGKEITTFQSSEIDNLEKSICEMLDYINVKYEWL